MKKCRQCKTRADHVYAKFCWHCGSSYKSGLVLESAYSVSQVTPQAKYDMSPRIIFTWGSLAMIAGIIWVTWAGINTIFLILPFTLALLLAFGGAVLSAFLDFRQGNTPEPQNLTGLNKIEVVHTVPGIDGPRIQIADPLEGLTFNNLRRVAEHCFAGKPFSSAHCRAMGLSQPKYYKLRTWLLDTGHAVKENPNSKTSRIIFTHNGKMLLRKALTYKGV